MYLYCIEQKQNQGLIDEYKKLTQSYIHLKNNTKILYDEIKEKNSDTTKELFFLDDIAINQCVEENDFFVEYKRNRKNAINSKLNSKYLKEDKIKKLFKIKQSRMERHLSNLNEENLGTTLNLLAEFYNQIYRDLDRNTIKNNEFIRKLFEEIDNEFSNKYKYDQESHKEKSYSFHINV